MIIHVIVDHYLLCVLYNVVACCLRRPGMIVAFFSFIILFGLKSLHERPTLYIHKCSMNKILMYSNYLLHKVTAQERNNKKEQSYDSFYCLATSLFMWVKLASLFQMKKNHCK